MIFAIGHTFDLVPGEKLPMHVFLDAAIASLYEGLSVRNAFVKIAKSNGKWLFFAYLCTYIECPTIHWSVCPLFCLSVHHSVYLSIHLSIHMSVATL